ncbi:hypothetical protein IAT38_006411 [Cryptococcus sp. DSM 104549]
MSSSTGRSSEPRPVKRRKTLRACDYCRAHRIRCEYSSDVGDCQHCIDYGLECTKVAPAPPDKRKRAAPSGEVHDPALSQGLEPSYLGPSSLTQLVYSSCAGNIELKRQLEEFGNRYDHHWDSLGHTKGLGLLVGRDEEQHPRHRVPGKTFCFNQTQARLTEQIGSQQILDTLYATALQRVIPLFPVVSASESVCSSGTPPGSWYDLYTTWSFNSTPPSPMPHIVRLIHWCLPALSRDTPQPIRHSLLSTLHEHLDSGEIARLSGTTTLANAQVLVLLSMNQDLNSYEESTAVSMQWQRVGTGLRMALELALHRDVSSKAIPIAQIHRRWRVWAACVSVDKWMALRSGQAQTINLEDCDAPGAFGYPDHFVDEDHAEGPRCFAPIVELGKLSALLGRILRLTKSPFALDRATDTSFMEWQRDMDVWVQHLPSSWNVSAKLPIQQANSIFNILTVAVEFQYLQPFMFPTRPVPPHITFRPDPERWIDLLIRSEHAIEWMELSEGQFYLDVWSMMAYPLAVCVLAQLHEYRKTNDMRPLSYLERGERIFQIWGKIGAEGPAGDRSYRKRVADMVSLLRVSAGDHQQYMSVEAILQTIFAAPGSSELF